MLLKILQNSEENTCVRVSFYMFATLLKKNSNAGVLVLSLGVTTPLITPVMDMTFPGSVGKYCFDMLKSIEFGDLVGLFASSRRSDRVYLG